MVVRHGKNQIFESTGPVPTTPKASMMHKSENLLKFKLIFSKSNLARIFFFGMDKKAQVIL